MTETTNHLSMISIPNREPKKSASLDRPGFCGFLEAGLTGNIYKIGEDRFIVAWGQYNKVLRVSKKVYSGSDFKLVRTDRSRVWSKKANKVYKLAK